MKKFLTGSLAAAMVLSMGAAALAAEVDAEQQITEISKEIYTEEDGVVNKKLDESGNETIAYGKTAYYPLLNASKAGVTSSDAVKGMSLKQKWEMNGGAVEKVEIVKKKQSGLVDSANDYIYFLSVKLKNSNSYNKIDVIGEVTLRKSSGYKFEETLSVNLPVAYKYAETADEEVGSTAKVYNFGTSGENQLDTDPEQEIELKNVGYFTVDTTGQGKILLAVDTKFNADVAAKYPNANLDFVNGNGATFNKTGELTIEADAGTYLYELSADGVMKAVKAEYDEYEEAFKVKTRTLGRYVISDVELELVNEPSAPESSDPGSDGNGGVVNPPSGARA